MAEECGQTSLGNVLLEEALNLISLPIRQLRFIEEDVVSRLLPFWGLSKINDGRTVCPFTLSTMLSFLNSDLSKETSWTSLMCTFTRRSPLMLLRSPKSALKSVNQKGSPMMINWRMRLFSGMPSHSSNSSNCASCLPWHLNRQCWYLRSFGSGITWFFDHCAGKLKSFEIMSVSWGGTSSQRLSIKKI